MLFNYLWGASKKILSCVKGAKKVDRAAKEKQDRLDYFTRNLI